MKKNKPKLSVMIVEDERDLLDLYEESFRNNGFHTIAVDDGEKALKELEKQDCKVNMVILDLMLPGISGFDVLQAMKEKERLKDIPVIVASNLSDKRDIEKAFSLGVNEYFVKIDKTPPEIVRDVMTICSNEDIVQRKKVKIFN